MGLLDDDLDAVLADLEQLGETVTIVLGVQAVEAIRDVTDEAPALLAELRAPADAVVVLVKQGSLTGLAIDAACTVDAVAYVVRHYGPGKVDNRLTRVVLVPA